MTLPTLIATIGVVSALAHANLGGGSELRVPEAQAAVLAELSKSCTEQLAIVGQTVTCTAQFVNADREGNTYIIDSAFECVGPDALAPSPGKCPRNTRLVEFNSIAVSGNTSPAPGTEPACGTGIPGTLPCRLAFGGTITFSYTYTVQGSDIGADGFVSDYAVTRFRDTCEGGSSDPTCKTKPITETDSFAVRAATATNTPTNTPTNAPTNTPTATVMHTPTNTPTTTPIPTKGPR
jgi:hypothetical protein